MLQYRIRALLWGAGMLNRDIKPWFDDVMVVSLTYRSLPSICLITVTAKAGRGIQRNSPAMPTVVWQEARPASLDAWQVYLPLSVTWLLLMHSTATLLLKLTSYFSELWISVSSLYQLTDMGCEPDTLPSIFTSRPSVSSVCSEGFLVNTGGFLRSVKGKKSWWRGREGSSAELWIQSSNTFNSDVRGAGDLPHIVHGVAEVLSCVTFFCLQNGQVGGVVHTTDAIIPTTTNIFVIFGPGDFNRGRPSHVTLQLYAVAHCHFLWCQFPVKDWRVSGFCRPTKKKGGGGA